MSSLNEKTKIRINRDILEKFLPDNASIRKFEELLRVLNNLIPEDLETLLALIEESEIQNTQNYSKINSINSLVQILIKAVDIIESKPNQRLNKKPQLDYIDFYTEGNVVDKPGRVYWKDSDDKSLNVVMNDVGVVLQVGQEQYYLAKNTSGSTIQNGSLCKFTGTIGASGKLTVGLGYGLDDENVLMGVATQDIANNEFGFITHFGLIRGINTTGSSYGETWSAGDFLYPSSTVAGRFTNIRPDAPNLREPLASVIYSGSSNGSIFVRMKTGETIDHLHDVQLTSLSNGDLLQYISANSRWENKSISSILPSNILYDTDIGITVQGYNANTVIDASYVHTDNNFTTALKTNYDAAYSHSLLTSGNPHNVTKSDVGLGNVENTALSTWVGSTNITILGTISSGTWQGSVISQTYLAEDTTKIDKVTLTDNAIVRANGTSGSVQNSGVIIDDSDNMSGINNITIETINTNFNKVVITGTIINTDGTVAIAGLDFNNYAGQIAEVTVLAKCKSGAGGVRAEYKKALVKETGGNALTVTDIVTPIGGSNMTLSFTTSASYLYMNLATNVSSTESFSFVIHINSDINLASNFSVLYS